MASKVIDDLNVTGTITASGYNDSNWNTAHGWGNHSGLYDDYSSFNLKTNGVQRTTVTSGGTIDIVASSNMTVAYGAGGVVTLSSANDNTTYSAGTGLDLTGTTFSVESDLRDVSHIGKDSNNYIAFNVGAAGHTDFYVAGTWSARLQANGELHVIGDIVAFSDIFIP
tara:strand:+ start:3209 stop:3712 length:504 start_codon:yes stop_codon:yes gene_type:complete